MPWIKGRRIASNPELPAEALTKKRSLKLLNNIFQPSESVVFLNFLSAPFLKVLLLWVCFRGNNTGCE